jgi:hypothetical protein
LNKKFVSILVVLSTLAFTFTSAFKTPHVTQISLQSVTYLKEKGVTFKFLANGDFKRSDLQGNVVVNGKSIRLYCNYSGDPAPVVVVCTAAKGTAKLAGNKGIVFIAGRSFLFTVPARTIF